MAKPTTNYQLPTTKHPKVAIVHDWLIGGGAEKVVEQLHKMYPEAPIYTSYCTPEWRKKLGGRVITGYLQHWPFPALRKFIPVLRALWFSGINLRNYDLVISSSGAEAKFIRVRAGTTHVAYIHAPTHYYWSRFDQYIKNPGFGSFDPIARLGLKLFVGPMRLWDKTAAKHPDFLIANSNFTRDEIKKYYDRDSIVIHPPVDIERFSKASQDANKREGFVVTGRQTPYKRIDLAIQACTELNLPLTVVGAGPDAKRLASLAGPSIKFTGWVDDAQLPKILGSSKAFIFAGVDDFGISAVEALAAGTPVIAYKAGGALDYVKEGKTGLFFGKQTAESLQAALTKFTKLDFKPADVKRGAQQFSAENFRKQFTKFIASVKVKSQE